MRLGDGIIRQVQAAGVHRRGMRIEQLDKVVLEQDQAVGEPFVDLERRRVAERLGGIGLTEGRGRQTPPAVVSGPADGQVRHLQAEFDRIQQHGGVIIEVKPLPIAIESEAQMNA